MSAQAAESRARQLLALYGPILRSHQRPASQLIRERAEPWHVLHALLELYRRLVRRCRHRTSLYREVWAAVRDGGWLHSWADHMDPDIGPMPRRAQLAIARTVEQVERRVR